MALSNGSQAVSTTTVEIVAAAPNGTRDQTIVQLLSGDQVYIGIGEAAVDATGLTLKNVGDSISITKSQSRRAVNGICGAGDSAVVGWQEG